MLYLIVIILFIAIGYLYLQNKKESEKFTSILRDQEEQHKKDLDKYSGIINLEEAIKNLQNEKSQSEQELQNLRGDYKNKLQTFNELNKELHLVEEEYELTIYGLYKPIYSFETSEQYKKEIDSIREKQKNMILEKTAVYCSESWTVGGSLKEGAKLTDKAIKLTLRAFNGECDAIIAKVKWNNYNTMRERIIKSFEVINKLNVTSKVFIPEKYLNLKLEELKLTHEYHEKAYEEKEEQRAIREQMREEEKALKEIEKAQADTEKEEIQYQKALQKAHEQLSKAKEEEMGVLNAQIEELNRKLAEAEAKKERALSMAQQTRSGHVYVISNIGSFGENVYKIGMTRRLEPLDRVRELGDASVPFLFDVHAMIYSKDAPKLERSLHKTFNNNRVNMVNGRKEFFNVSLDLVEQEVKRLGETIEFTKIVEAKEYNETISMRNAGIKPTVEDIADDDRFPEEL